MDIQGSTILQRYKWTIGSWTHRGWLLRTPCWVKAARHVHTQGHTKRSYSMRPRISSYATGRTNALWHQSAQRYLGVGVGVCHGWEWPWVELSGRESFSTFSSWWWGPKSVPFVKTHQAGHSLCTVLCVLLQEKLSSNRREMTAKGVLGEGRAGRWGLAEGNYNT